MTFRRAPSGLIKPPHRTGVNWGNSISLGLKHQLVCTDLGAFDDASGKKYEWSDPSATSFAQATKKWGSGITTGASSRLLLGAGSRLVGGANGDVTARWLFQTLTVGALQALARASTNEAWYITSSAKLAYYTGSSFAADSATTFVNRTVYDVVIRRYGSNNLNPDIFINGRPDTLGYGAGTEFNVTNFDIWGDAFSQIMPGPKFMWQAWQRWLTDNEIASLYREPFQLSLNQTPRRRVAVRTAAGATGNVKTVDGLALSGVKTFNGLAKASTKTWNGITL